MIGVTSDILDLCSPIFQPDFKSVDIPRLKVKPLYAFVEKLSRLALLVEFEVTLLLNEALAGFSIGTYGDNLYILLTGCDDGTCAIASDSENKEDEGDWNDQFCWKSHIFLPELGKLIKWTRNFE